MFEDLTTPVVESDFSALSLNDLPPPEDASPLLASGPPSSADPAELPPYAGAASERTPSSGRFRAGSAAVPRLPLAGAALGTPPLPHSSSATPPMHPHSSGAMQPSTYHSSSVTPPSAYLSSGATPPSAYPDSARSSIGRRERASLKRAAAAAWIHDVLGVDVPHASDRDFRAALADGVVLCRLMNAARPGAVPRIVSPRADGALATPTSERAGSTSPTSPPLAPGEVRRNFENVTNFIHAVRGITADTFSARDLEDRRDRPAVAQCILSLRDALHAEATGGRTSGRTPDQRSAGTETGAYGIMSAAAASGAAGGPASYGVSPAAPFSFTPAASAVVARHGAGGALATSPGPEGLSYLMRSCTHMLKARMGLPTTPQPGGPGDVDAGRASARGRVEGEPLASARRRALEAEALPAGAAPPRASGLVRADSLGSASTATAPEPAPEAALDAVGPVLEAVLANLTTEYEKRLLAKDQELKLAHEAHERERRKVGELQERVDELRAEGERRRRGGGGGGGGEEYDSEEADEGGYEDAENGPRGQSGRALPALSRLGAPALARRLVEAESALEEANGRIRSLEREVDERARAARSEALEQAEDEIARLTAAARDAGEARELLEEELRDAQRRARRARTLAAENRVLYNEIQDLKGSIRVFCRVRPAGATGDRSERSVTTLGARALECVSTRTGRAQRFAFDRVFGERSAQREVYAATKPLVRSVLDGYDVCVFAYGQTGSGKTHTMGGSGTDALALADDDEWGAGTRGDDREAEEELMIEDDMQHGGGYDADDLPSSRRRRDSLSGAGGPERDRGSSLGLYQRALGDLFAIRDERRGEVDYEVSVQLLEIYNETVRDLLADSSAPSSGGGLDISMLAPSGANVAGITTVPVTGRREVLEVLARGAAARATAATNANERSSRSHQVLTILVRGTPSGEAGGRPAGGTARGPGRSRGPRGSGSGSSGAPAVPTTLQATSACLHLVDLAGSERLNRSGAVGAQLREAQAINKSLSALGNVMKALAQKAAHVPFRDSKLTQLLAASLGRQAKAMMFVHVAPELGSSSETLSTLQFAEQVSAVTLGAARKNSSSSSGGSGGASGGSLGDPSDPGSAASAIERVKRDLESTRRELGDARGEAERLARALEDARAEAGREAAAAASAARRESDGAARALEAELRDEKSRLQRERERAERRSDDLQRQLDDARRELDEARRERRDAGASVRRTTSDLGASAASRARKERRDGVGERERIASKGLGKAEAFGEGKGRAADDGDGDDGDGDDDDDLEGASDRHAGLHRRRHRHLGMADLHDADDDLHEDRSLIRAYRSSARDERDSESIDRSGGGGGSRLVARDLDRELQVDRRDRPRDASLHSARESLSSASAYASREPSSAREPYASSAYAPHSAREPYASSAYAPHSARESPLSGFARSSHRSPSSYHAERERGDLVGTSAHLSPLAASTQDRRGNFSFSRDTATSVARRTPPPAADRRSSLSSLSSPARTPRTARGAAATARGAAGGGAGAGAGGPPLAFGSRASSARGAQHTPVRASIAAKNPSPGYAGRTNIPLPPPTSARDSPATSRDKRGAGAFGSYAIESAR